MNLNWIQTLVNLPPVVDAMLKMTVLLAAAWILHFAIRRGNPRWRVLLWRGAAVGLVMLPLLSVLLPEVSVPVIPREEEPLPLLPRQEILVGYVPLSLDSGAVGEWLPPNSTKDAGPSTVPTVATDMSLTNWLGDHSVMLLAGAWLAMAAGLTLFALKRHARLWRLLKTSRPAPKSAYQLLQTIAADLGCKLDIELRCCARVASPFLIGLRHPVVVLPAQMAEPNFAEDLRGVLVHELAHWKLRDLLWTRVFQTLSIVCWFHPLMWRTRAVHTTACEEVCDAVAADYLGDADGYSGTLARVALGLARRRHAYGGVPMARTPQIRLRLEALKKKLWSSRLRRGSIAISLLAGVIAVAGLGGLKLRQVSDVFTPASGEAAPGGEITRSGSPGSRVVHFPRNRSLGALSVQDVNVKRQIETFYHWINGTSWESFSEARGEVTVPAGKRLWLSVGKDAWKDLSPLSRLAPDALYRLSLPYVSPGEEKAAPDDRCMRHVAHLTGLKVLDLTGTSITAEGLKAIAGFKSLEYLTLPLTTTDAGLADVARASSLRRLYLHPTKVTDAGLAHLAKLRLLEELELGGQHIGDAGLAHIGELPSLRYLLLRSKGFSDAGLAHLKGLRSLRILNLMHLPITDAGLVHLSGLSELENLSLYNTQVTDAGIVHLKRMRSLKKLDLGKRERAKGEITDKGVAHLSGLKSLEYLNVSGDHVTDKGLAHLSELPNLKHLSLPTAGRARSYTDKGLKYLSRVRSLEELSVCGVGVTDAGMSHIAKLANLKDLTLFGCPITGKGLAELTKLRSLKELSLFGSRVTLSDLAQLNAMPSLTYLRVYPFERGPGVLDIGKLTQLEKLTIGLAAFRDEDLACLAKFTRLKWLQGIWGISDVGMAHLAGLTSMERLGVGGPGLTDKGMAYLANMKNLNHLSVTGDITDRGLRHLEGLQRLGFLSITAEDAFSNAALNRLRRSLPKLHTLHVIP